MEQLEMIKEFISQTDDAELVKEIINYGIKRWGSMFPDWEIVLLTSPRNDPQAKKDLIAYAFNLIDREEAAKNTKCAWQEEIKELLEK